MFDFQATGAIFAHSYECWSRKVGTRNKCITKK